METELHFFDIFNFDTLNKQDLVKLEGLFNDLKDKNFPSIVKQYTTDNELRRNLDSILLEILGCSKFEIPRILDNIYSTISEELSSK